MRRNISTEHRRQCLATVAVALSIIFALDATGQETTKKIQIDVADSSTAIDYKLDDSSPTPVELELLDAKDVWNFVQFDKLPDGVQLTVKKDVPGYENEAPIKEHLWYPFKRELPLLLEIKTQPRSAVVISLTFGKVYNQYKDQFLATKEIKEVRQSLRQNPQMLQFVGELRTLKIINNRSILDPTPSPSPATSSSRLNYLINEEPLFGVVVIIIIVLVGSFIVYLIGWRLIPLLKPKFNQLRFNRKPKMVPPNLDVLGDLHTPIRESERHDESNRDAIGNQSGMKTGLYDPLRHGHDNTQLTSLEERVKELDSEIEEKLERRDSRIQEIENTTKTLISQQEQRLRSELQESLSQLTDKEVKPVFQLLADQASQLKQTEENFNGKIEDQKREIEALATKEEHLKDQLINVSKELTKMADWMRESQSSFEAKLQREPIPDSFYAKTLGDVLAQNVETLRDGNFDRLIGQRLEQFFQTVKRGEGLQDLRQRADRIMAALKEVAKQAESLNAVAYDQIRHRLQQVEAVITDLSGMQSQLQERRAVLQIPVSLHSGGRQTLLDGLGRGIKREIEKLEDPERYFEGELERLITADVIAIVDICDKQVATPPGSRAEVENTLSELFSAASLTSILPRPGDTFKTAEQDLIETSQQSGPSLKVAHVITRGFIFKHGDKETLLRKAGVSVYR